MTNNEELPRIINYSTQWPKFSQYEIINFEDKPYIVPARGSSLTQYNPFEIHNHAGFDALNLGDYLFKEFRDSLEMENLDWISIATQDKEVLGKILRYLARYGVMGTNRIGHEKTERNVGRFRIYPEEKPNFFNFEQYDNSITPDYNPFCEQLNAFICCVLDVYRLKKICDTFTDGRYSENDHYVKIPQDIYLNYFENDHFIADRGGIDQLNLSWGERLKLIKATPSYISVTTDPKGQLKMEYSFHKLYDAIRTIVIQELASIKFCSRCGNLFTVEYPNQAYCTPYCRNRASVKRARDKVKRVNELYSKGLSISEISKECGTTETQILKWIKESEK